MYYMVGIEQEPIQCSGLDALIKHGKDVTLRAPEENGAIQVFISKERKSKLEHVDLVVQVGERAVRLFRNDGHNLQGLVHIPIENPVTGEKDIVDPRFVFTDPVTQLTLRPSVNTENGKRNSGLWCIADEGVQYTDHMAFELFVREVVDFASIKLKLPLMSLDN